MMPFRQPPVITKVRQRQASLLWDYSTTARQALRLTLDLVADIPLQQRGSLEHAALLEGDEAVVAEDDVVEERDAVEQTARL